MQLIKPLEIASKIMGLIEEAKEFMVIVCPYYRFGNWRKLNRVLEAAKDRDLPLLFYVREGEYASVAELTDIGINPVSIYRLHAKLYFNEKEAIISSMNLIQSSDDDSLDMAQITENEKEYREVVSFYEKFIKSKGKQHIDLDDFLLDLSMAVSEIFRRSSSVAFEDNS